jgi:hypothetical protein
MFNQPVSRVAILALCLMLFGGCGAQPGRTVMTYGKGKTPPPLAKADVAGEYRLFASNSPNAMYTAHLNEGDEYGFVRKGEGKQAKTFAVAKGQEIPLEGWLSTSYYWKRQEEK